MSTFTRARDDERAHARRTSLANDPDRKHYVMDGPVHYDPYPYRPCSLANHHHVGARVNANEVRDAADSRALARANEEQRRGFDAFFATGDRVSGGSKITCGSRSNGPIRRPKTA